MVKANNFSGNRANGIGGAVYYNLVSPAGLLENLYSGNNASYGPNYGSYPFKLALFSAPNVTNTDLNSLVSGSTITQTIEIGIYDQEGQLVTADSSSECWLTSQDVNLQISGNNKQVAKVGVYQFDSITFLASPLYHTALTLISNALDQNKISAVTGKTPNRKLLIYHSM